MTHSFRLVLLSLLFAAPAAAQTVASLSATGAVTVMPDQMVATLMAQANAPRAAAAAAAVNRAVAVALGQARAVQGVIASTADYNEASVTDENGRVTGYQASQALDLTMSASGGVPAPAFTDLLGRLQGEGLLLNQLDGQLSDAGAAAAQRAAITDAIHRLQGNAAAVAAALHDQVGAIRTLTLDMSNPGPIMPGMRMMMAAAAPPPQAAPGPVTVTANISAEVNLSPIKP